jgi:hypothetical protein
MINLHWISEQDSFCKVSNELYKIEINWSKNISLDLLELSQHYFDSAMEICREIVYDSKNDNIKYDMWFLPCVYLFRHSIELLLKAGLSKETKFKSDLQAEFLNAKHNLELLFVTYKNNTGSLNLSDEELIWVENYLKA